MEPSDLVVGLGFLLMAEGLPLFAAPDRYRRLLARIETLPDRVLRYAGLAAMGVGLALWWSVA